MADGADNIHTLYHFAEDGVLAVEPGRLIERDEDRVVALFRKTAVRRHGLQDAAVVHSDRESGEADLAKQCRGGQDQIGFHKIRRIAKHIDDERAKAAQDTLWRFVERGIIFAEMEDYTVHSVCHSLGISSASVGAVIARRYDVEKGEFIIDYDRNAKEKAELLPAQAIMTAFVEHAKAWK